MDNNNTLVFVYNDLVAYIEQLISKSIYYFFLNVYEKSKSSDSYRKFRTFQEKIKSIPEWSENTLDKYYKLILRSNTEDLENILEKIKKTYVAIYFPDFYQFDDLPAVSLKTYIHNVLKQTARDFFANPFVFDIEGQESFNFYLINQTIKNGVEAALRETLQPSVKKATYLKDPRLAYSSVKSPVNIDKSVETEIYRAHEYQPQTQQQSWFEEEPEAQPQQQTQQGGEVYKIDEAVAEAEARVLAEAGIEREQDSEEVDDVEEQEVEDGNDAEDSGDSGDVEVLDANSDEEIKATEA